MIMTAAEKSRPSDMLEPVRELLRDDDLAQEFLTSRWIGRAMGVLRRARRLSGLSQAEVAERMGTRQPSIARLEADLDGSVSLHRYAEYLAACGVLPFDVELVDTDAIRDYLLHDPSASVLAVRFREWLAITLNEEAEPVPETALADSRRPARDEHALGGAHPPSLAGKRVMEDCAVLPTNPWIAATRPSDPVDAPERSERLAAAGKGRFKTAAASVAA